MSIERRKSVDKPLQMEAGELKHIVITGASSGIGRALALHYAGPQTHLSLAARDSVRLAEVAEAVQRAGGSVATGLADVTDEDAVAALIAGFENTRPIDLLFANAGILDGRRQGQEVEDLSTARRVFDVNLMGALTTVHAVIPAMRRRRSGQIAIVSSLAAFSPLADAPAYAASKAALLSYGLGLREALAPQGIIVNVVTPGYVETSMTSVHKGAHPFKIGVEEAARRIARGIARDKAIIGFPTPLYLASRLSMILPDRWRRAGSAGLRFHVDKPSAE